jgi:hypothetical protein
VGAAGGVSDGGDAGGDALAAPHQRGELAGRQQQDRLGSEADDSKPLPGGQRVARLRPRDDAAGEDPRRQDQAGPAAAVRADPQLGAAVFLGAAQEGRQARSRLP